MAKALVKHGWPAKLRLPSTIDDPWSFYIDHAETGSDAAPDFWAAVEIATRVVARAYRIDVAESLGHVLFNRQYTLTLGGHFKEVKA